MKLKITKQVAGHLPIEAVTQTIAILAKRGAGKSYTASVMVEEMLTNGLLPVVIDPLGVWWGLQSSADGKSEGFPITVLGGDHGDVPLEPTAGVTIADFIVNEQQPCVIDLSHFSKADQIRFVTAFAERLYQKNREPLHLVVDEADMFAPQTSPRGYEARVLGVMEDLARRGRARGIGMTLVTQRSAVLNKNVLTQIECLIVMRTTSPQDRKAIEAWVSVHGEEDFWKEQINPSLTKLPIGTAWLWSPGWLDKLELVDVRQRTTFDSSATPKVGQRRIEPKKRAQPDLEHLRDQIAETIERAKKDDPRELRKQIGELQSQLATANKQKAAPPPEPPEPEVFEVFPEALRDRISDALIDAERGLEQVAKAVSGSKGFLRSAPTEKKPAKIERGRRTWSRSTPSTPEEGRQPPPPPPRSQRQSEASRRTSTRSDDDGKLSKAGRALLETLVSRSPMKLSRSQLSTLSGYKPKSSTYANALSELNTKGLIAKDGAGRDALFEPSQEGFDHIGTAAPAPKSPEEVREDWLAALPPTPQIMLGHLIHIYPHEVGRDELAECIERSPTSSTFANALSALRTNGLLEDVSRGVVRANPHLFE